MESNMFLVPDTYLAKIHTTETNRTGSYRNPCWSEQRRIFTVIKFWCTILVEQLPREFSNKVPQYLTTRFCMQTFSEFPCQHKIEATSSLFLEHHHQSETIKTNWPASVWKCKQREYVSFPNYYSWFSLFGSILISTLLFAGSHMCAYIDDWRVSSIIHEVQPIW